MKDCQILLIGKRFHVETDHKALVQILNCKNLEMSPRIQRLRMRLLSFVFTVWHVPGKSLIRADTLSRAPLTEHNEQQGQDLEEKINLYVQNISVSLPVSNTQLKPIREKQEENEVCRALKGYCSDGGPDRTTVPDALKPYWQAKEEISII